MVWPFQGINCLKPVSYVYACCVSVYAGSSKKSLRAHRQDKAKTTWDKTKRSRPQDKFFRQGFHSSNVHDSSFFSANAHQRVPVNEWKFCKFETPIATRRHKKYSPQKNRADRTNSRLFIRLSTCEPYWQSIAQTSFLDHAGPQPHALRSIQHHPLPIAEIVAKDWITLVHAT